MKSHRGCLVADYSVKLNSNVCRSRTSEPTVSRQYRVAWKACLSCRRWKVEPSTCAPHRWSSALATTQDT